MDLSLEMGWRHFLFENWPTDPDLLSAHLPDGLTPDEHDGTAWLYTQDWTGALRYTPVDHDSWTLYPAETDVETTRS